MSIDTDHFRSLLEDERTQVQNAIENLHEEHPGSLDDETDELATASDNHIGDSATATVSREIDYSLGENSGQILAEIEAALERIDAGTYGTCTKCEREIAEERLEARPWAALCIDCARDAERG